MMEQVRIKPRLHIFSVGELATNCYVVSCPATNQAVIIDPGDAADTISEYCVQESLSVVGILLTHGHFDHCLGLLELSLNFACASFMHEKDNFLIEDAQKRAEYWLKHPVDPVPHPTTCFSTPIQIPIGLFSVKVIETPGHTPGSICALLTHTGSGTIEALFTGDTLFSDAVGRTDLSYSNHNQLLRSLQKLKQLPETTLCYPGHGQPTFLSQTPLWTH